MKRVTIEIPPEQLGKLELDYLEPPIGEMSVIEGLKISGEVCVNLWKTPVDTITERVKDRLGLFEISPVSSSGKEAVLLVKKTPSKLTILIEKFNLYYEFPLKLDSRGAEISIRGTSRDMKKLFKALQKMRISVTVKRARDYITQAGIVSNLTEKQREALHLAIREGYFKTPRRTNAHRLAKSLGIRHTTFLLHLRRAQEKIFEGMELDAA